MSRGQAGLGGQETSSACTWSAPVLRATAPPGLCPPVPWGPQWTASQGPPQAGSRVCTRVHIREHAPPTLPPKQHMAHGRPPTACLLPAPSTPTMCCRHGDPRALTQHTHTRSCRPRPHTHPPCVGQTEPMSPPGPRGTADTLPVTTHPQGRAAAAGQDRSGAQPQPCPQRPWQCGPLLTSGRLWSRSMACPTQPQRLADRAPAGPPVTQRPRPHRRVGLQGWGGDPEVVPRGAGTFRATEQASLWSPPAPTAAPSSSSPGNSRSGN